MTFKEWWEDSKKKGTVPMWSSNEDTAKKAWNAGLREAYRIVIENAAYTDHHEFAMDCRDQITERITDDQTDET